MDLLHYRLEIKTSKVTHQHEKLNGFCTNLTISVELSVERLEDLSLERKFLSSIDDEGLDEEREGRSDTMAVDLS